MENTAKVDITEFISLLKRESECQEEYISHLMSKSADILQEMSDTINTRIDTLEKEIKSEYERDIGYSESIYNKGLVDGYKIGINEALLIVRESKRGHKKGYES